MEKEKNLDHMTLDEYYAFEDELRSYKGKDRVVSSAEIAQELSKREVPLFSVKTKYATLDRITENVEEGELVVITGPTGQGKTTLAFNITRTLSEQSVPSLWFSYEMSYSQLLRKMTTDNVFEFFMPKEMVTNHLDFIERRIMEAKIKYDCKVIFIDHLSMLYSLDKFAMKNVALELGDIVAKIKNMCLKHGVIIFLLAHTKKIDAGQEIFLEDLRDSGMIANLADIVLTVQRVPNDWQPGDRRIGQIEEHDTRTRIKVEKNRRAGTKGSFITNYESGVLRELDKNEWDSTSQAGKAFKDF